MSEALQRLFTHPATSTSQSEVVRAPPEKLSWTLKSTDLGDSKPIRAAAWIRMLPARLLGPVRGRPQPPSLSRARLGDLVEAGYWTVLADREPQELALGLARWDRRVEACVPTLDLTTETRTRPADQRARRRFRVYWALISPFAATTRRMVLRRIAAEAERGHAPTATVAAATGA